MRLSHSRALVVAIALSGCGGGAPVADDADDDDDPWVDAPPGDDAPAADAPLDAPLDALLDAPAGDGDRCATATPVELVGGTATFMDTNAGFADDYDAVTCTQIASRGPDRMYALALPAGQRVRAAVTPTVGDFDPSISLVRTNSCAAAPLDCLAGDDVGFFLETDEIEYNNPSAAPVDTRLLVDGWQADHGGAYTLTVEVTASPPGDVCLAAEPVTIIGGVATIHATTAGYLSDYDRGTPASSCTGNSTDGPDRVHRVTVPARTDLLVRLTPAAVYDAGVSLIAGTATECHQFPIPCLAGLDAAGPGGVEQLSYLNSALTPIDVMVVVDGDRRFDGGQGDPYTLEVRLLPLDQGGPAEPPARRSNAVVAARRGDPGGGRRDDDDSDDDRRVGPCRRGSWWEPFD